MSFSPAHGNAHYGNANIPGEHDPIQKAINIGTIKRDGKPADMTNFNWNKQFALQQAADDADLLQELLELFKGSCASDISLIERGLEQHDVEQVRAAAHSIKGAAASLGMHGIRDVALSIETAARDNNLSAAQEHLPVLERFGRELKNL